MLTTKECSKYLEEFNLKNNEIIRIRNSLYCITESVIDTYIDKKLNKWNKKNA